MTITEEDIRFYIKDGVESDNPLLAGELRYSSEEIAQAMRTAAREFNSLPPIGVISVDPAALPGDTNVFLDGVTAALLRMTLINEAANDLQVSGGNVQVQVGAAQIAHLKTLIPMFDERFRTTATNIKIARNLSNAFGSIGGTI
jgi:hypothetical protein